MMGLIPVVILLSQLGEEKNWGWGWGQKKQIFIKSIIKKSCT